MLRPKRVNPISVSEIGFWDGHNSKGQIIGGVTKTIPLYKALPNHTQYSRICHQASLSLRERAAALGISVVEESGLNRGSHDLSSEEWDKVFEIAKEWPIWDPTTCKSIL